MKKIATMLAAGVVALGASSQAAEVSSTEYALITIPLERDVYNLVGVSVLPLDPDATVEDVFTGLNSTAKVQTYNNGDRKSPAEVSVSLGQAVWITNATVSTVYELGVAPSVASYTNMIYTASPVPVVTPFAAAWSPADTDLNLNSSTVRSKANKVSIWKPALKKYYEYVFIPDQGWKAANRWTPAYDDEAPPSIGAGEGVFVTFSPDRLETKTVKFNAPVAQ